MGDHIRDSQKSPIYQFQLLVTLRFKTNAHTRGRELITNSIVKKRKLIIGRSQNTSNSHYLIVCEKENIISQGPHLLGW
jgi:lipoate-protein ligase A